MSINTFFTNRWVFPQVFHKPKPLKLFSQKGYCTFSTVSTAPTTTKIVKNLLVVFLLRDLQMDCVDTNKSANMSF